MYIFIYIFIIYIYIYYIYNITYIYRNFICLFIWKCQMEIYKKIINISSLSLYVYIYIYIYIYRYIWKTKYEVFLQWNTKFFFFRKFCFSYNFGSCQNCMSSANHQKLCNKRVLSTREPCTFEYVTLLQSFHRGTVSIHWYIAQNF